MYVELFGVYVCLLEVAKRRLSMKWFVYTCVFKWFVLLKCLFNHCNL